MSMNGAAADKPENLNDCIERTHSHLINIAGSLASIELGLNGPVPECGDTNQPAGSSGIWNRLRLIEQATEEIARRLSTIRDSVGA